MNTAAFASTRTGRTAAIVRPGSVVAVARSTSTSASRIPAKTRAPALTKEADIDAYACPVREFFKWANPGVF